MSVLDNAILRISPGWAAKREAARLKYAQAKMMGKAYEAADFSRTHNPRKLRDFGSGNTVTSYSGIPLRNMARDLDRNHDLARGILNILVRNTVGPNGISVEPTPTMPDGTINSSLADQLAELHRDWCKNPEVTGEYNWARAEQLVARSWFRDGEVLYQLLQGPVQFLDHGTMVPFSVELIEADLLPFYYTDVGSGIINGVQRDAWGRPKGYWIYKYHPGELVPMANDLKYVSADFLKHIKLVDRIGTVRGVSMFASVLNRLDDIKDYEESERVAAKIAARICAVIKKGVPADYSDLDINGNPRAPRQIAFDTGMIIDSLLPGEDISMLDSNRPNPNLVNFRDGQLRAVAAGADVSNSSATKNYNGTYSAQRQELIEQAAAYQLLGHNFVDQCSQPVYEAFVATALLSGKIKLPRSMTAAGLSQAVYGLPQIPWIDPEKEAAANEILEKNTYRSAPEIIRSRGGNPRVVLKEQQAWMDQLKAAGIPFNTGVLTGVVPAEKAGVVPQPDPTVAPGAQTPNPEQETANAD